MLFFFIYILSIFFFFQAEDGIRDSSVTGVQTCALPISLSLAVLALGVLYQLGLAQTQSSPLPGAQDVIGNLKQSIDWFRQFTIEEQAATDPGDLLFLNDDHQTAIQIVRLSFDFARADAQALAGQAASGSNTGTPDAGKYASLVRAAQEADAEVQQTRAELEADKSKLQGVRGSERKKLQSTVDELQSELNLAQSRSKTLHEILQFVSGASGASGNLAQQIDQLERSIPELVAENAKVAGTQANPPPLNSTTTTRTLNRRTQPSGILNLTEDLCSLSQQIRIIDQRMQSTDALAHASQKLREPLLAHLAEVAQRGEEAAKQADVSSPAQLEQLKHDLDVLTASFTQTSNIVLPLSKQAVLFDLYKSNLGRWRDVVKYG